MDQRTRRGRGRSTSCPIKDREKRRALELVAARLAGPQISDLPLIQVFNPNWSGKRDTALRAKIKWWFLEM